ncbi:SAM-dependent methyltransferase [Methanolobus sp. ZRKC2]|uniref:SAM-dependent methyltransferase n=1 Tax=Methanolobus sp. ZRKC2 TaxID=3125783 RepID=UPI003250958B
MSVEYKNIVPWGRSFQEYIDMFNLSDEDLDRSILGCGDGPASFNCEMTQEGKTVVSVDPVYNFDRDIIEKRIDETYTEVLEQTRANQDKFVWESIPSVEELGKIRMESMKLFLDDFEAGKLHGRYIAGELPELPFIDDSFDLVLVSHLLFLYSEQLSLDFHLQAMDELLRVAREVRVFPLLDLNSRRSLYVDEVVDYLSEKGYSVREEKVDYEFQKGGNRMLRITRV